MAAVGGVFVGGAASRSYHYHYYYDDYYYDDGAGCYFCSCVASGYVGCAVDYFDDYDYFAYDYDYVGGWF